MGGIGSLVHIQMAEKNKHRQILETEVVAGTCRAVDPPRALSAPVCGTAVGGLQAGAPCP